MIEDRKQPKRTSERMASYRNRMRAAGLRPVQIWAPDRNAEGFAEKCRQQALAIAQDDPGGDEALRLIETVYEWPEP